MQRKELITKLVVRLMLISLTIALNVAFFFWVQAADILQEMLYVNVYICIPSIIAILLLVLSIRIKVQEYRWSKKEENPGCSII